MSQEVRPAHSPLGASSAERWMNCPGSVALIDKLNLPSTESEYAMEGTRAHAMAAYCLDKGCDAWEAIGFGDWIPDMVEPVQVYLDEVRRLDVASSVMFLEHKIQSKRHPLFYGTVDLAVVDGSRLHIRDFKYGAGVVVEIEGNPQILYYAYGILQRFPAVETVTLGIVQPRAHHPDGPIRVVETPASEIRRWAEQELFPAMDAVSVDRSLTPGSWCRFCPAKLVCPMLTGIFGAASRSDPLTVAEYSDGRLDREYDLLPAVKNYIAAVEKAMLERLERGAKMEFAKLVNKKASRVWREGAMEKLVAEGFHLKQILTEPELKTPPQIEKLGPAAQALVKEYAYTPFTGITVAHALDSRPAVRAHTAQEVFAHFTGDKK